VLASGIAFAFALGAGCTSRVPAQPQRIYERIAIGELKELVAKVLVDAGYRIERDDPARATLQTGWRGSATERRLYSVWIDLDVLSRRAILYLNVVAEQRASAGAAWATREIAPAQDADFQRLLTAIDRAVADRGIQGVPVR
jgi:hypothetical protein